MGLERGSRLLFEFDPEVPDVVRIRRLRRSYLGVARGVYGGTSEEIDAYVRGERQSWEEAVGSR
jgi:hypothetical protein